MVLYSYAKLNLYLEVLNKRKDGYHNLKTIFERINLRDKIVVKPRQDKEINIIASHPAVPKDKTNLCYRSALVLQDEFNIHRGLDIRILKRIPVGAGLGGGSSNAASVLMGLNKLWKLRLSKNKLASLAQKIGSDVPFFVYNVPFAIASNRGDKIKPLKILETAKLWHILVIPKIQVSTPYIYKKWDTYSRLNQPWFTKYRQKKIERAGLTRTQLNDNILLLALKKNNLSELGKLLLNNLEPVTIRLYPEVGRVREKLAEFGVKSILMSGSGPAVFGVVSSRKEAVSIGSRLGKENKSWKIFVARTF